MRLQRFLESWRGLNFALRLKKQMTINLYRRMHLAGFGVVVGLVTALLCGFTAGCTADRNMSTANERLIRADAMLAERCTTAGEKIYRTVDDVEGVYLLRVRPDSLNYGDQFKMDDPYGSDSTGDQYILNFLRGFYHQRNSPPAPGEPPQVGFLYVEAVDPLDGRRYRYTPVLKDVSHKRSLLMGGEGPATFVTKDFVFDKRLASGTPPRYGVTYDDISTREDREYWIAGSSLRVIDLTTNEVIAERVGYMMDRGQGSRASARSPWFFAANDACPGFQRSPMIPPSLSNGGGAAAQPGQTLYFVEKVLKPRLKQAG